MGSGASKSSDSGTPMSAKKGSGVNVSVRFRHGTPATPFDEAIGCFKAVGYSNKISKDGTLRSVTTTSQPGYLYRLVNHTSRQWFFYNDTTSYDFLVTGYFGPGSAICPMGRAKMYRELPSGLVVVELTVGPLETLGYLEGEVRDGFDITFTAVSRKGTGNNTTTAALATASPSVYSRGSRATAVSGNEPALSATNSIRPVSALHGGPVATARGREGSAIISHSPHISPTAAAALTTPGAPIPVVAPTPTAAQDHSAALSFCPHCHATTLVTTSVPSPAPTSHLALASPPPPVHVLPAAPQQRQPLQPASPQGSVSRTGKSPSYVAFSSTERVSPSPSNADSGSGERSAPLAGSPVAPLTSSESREGSTSTTTSHRAQRHSKEREGSTAPTVMTASSNAGSPVASGAETQRRRSSGGSSARRSRKQYGRSSSGPASRRTSPAPEMGVAA